MKIRLATRKSALALTQARWVAAQLRVHHPSIEVEEVPITTTGDRVLDRPLAQIGGKGLFVREVQAALLDGRADVAVHSLKDVPGDEAPPEGLELACFPLREDPHDAWISREGLELDALEAGSRVGTSSLRRICQLRALRPDLRYLPLRGNVDTRLRKLKEGEYEAVVLAAAGLRRLGLESEIQERLPFSTCLPAVGQGTLGLEIRSADLRMRDLLAPLSDTTTHWVSECERALLAKLQGSCHVPIAGLARWHSGEQRLSLRAMVGSHDTERTLNARCDRFVSRIEAKAMLEVARALGEEAADVLIAQGARQWVVEAEAAVLRQRQQSNGNGHGHW